MTARCPQASTPIEKDLAPLMASRPTQSKCKKNTNSKGGTCGALETCLESGWTEASKVHGKGLGSQKLNVFVWLWVKTQKPQWRCSLSISFERDYLIAGPSLPPNWIALKSWEKTNKIKPKKQLNNWWKRHQQNKLSQNNHPFASRTTRKALECVVRASLIHCDVKPESRCLVMVWCRSGAKVRCFFKPS